MARHTVVIQVAIVAEADVDSVSSGDESYLGLDKSDVLKLSNIVVQDLSLAADSVVVVG